MDDFREYMGNIDISNLPLLEQASENTGVKYRTGDEKEFVSGTKTESVFRAVFCRNESDAKRLIEALGSLGAKIAGPSRT